MSNATNRTKTIAVVQGEFAVSRAPDDVFSTILGSCISVCLFDRSTSTGGMNHFLLPSQSGKVDGDRRYGAHAMELLINGMLKGGAQKQDLQAKVFGGASMSSNLADFGAANAKFAQQFLADENIPVVGTDVGGKEARRVRFWPHSGRTHIALVPNRVDEPRPASHAISARKDAVTLF